MSRQRRLRVEPPEPSFHMEHGRATCTIILTNYSREYVAFKIRGLYPDRFRASTPYGIMDPGSHLNITVTMLGQAGNLPNMLHETFTIHSLAVRRDDTWERIRTLFITEERRVHVFDLTVAHMPHQHRNLNNIQEPDMSFWGLLRTGVIVVFSCMMFWYLMKQILSRLGVIISAITFLVLRIMRNRAVETVEEWIWRTVLYSSLYYLSTIGRNLLRRSARWLDVGSRAFLGLLRDVFGHQERRRSRPNYRN